MTSDRNTFQFLLAACVTTLAFGAYVSQMTGTDSLSPLPSLRNITSVQIFTGSENSSLRSAEASDDLEDTGNLCRIVRIGDAPSGCRAGIDAVNENLTEDGLNLKISVSFVPEDEFLQEPDSFITANRSADILQLPQDRTLLVRAASSGIVLSLESFLEENPDISDSFGREDLAGVCCEDGCYALPGKMIPFQSVSSGLCYRSDIAVKSGFPVFPEDTTGVLDLMEKTQKAILDESGILAYSWLSSKEDTADWLHRSYSSWPFYIGDDLGLVIVRQDGSVESFCESSEFRKDCDTYREMYEKGFTDPDVLDIDYDFALKDNADYGSFLPSPAFETGCAENADENLGIDYVDVKEAVLCPENPDLVTGINRIMSLVPASDADKDNAFLFLRWLYGDEENLALYENAVEDVFVPSAAGYYITPAAGFAFDTTDMASVRSRLEKAVREYIWPLKFGTEDYDSCIEEAVAALRKAGLESYLTEYRKQLEEYCRENPDIAKPAGDLQICH